jgi:hypothetical protein
LAVAAASASLDSFSSYASLPKHFANASAENFEAFYSVEYAYDLALPGLLQKAVAITFRH